MGFLKELAPDNTRWRAVRRGEDHYQVRRPDGTVYGDYPSLSQAAGIAGRRQKEDDAAAQRMVRPCMCCRVPFHSEGIHNRLCDGCRRQGDGLMQGGLHASRGGRRRLK